MNLGHKQKKRIDGKRLTENIMHFARVLRVAGLPIGSAQIIEAVRAVDYVGIKNRNDLYWTLSSVFINRYSQRHLYDQAFHMFWRNPKILERAVTALLPSFSDNQENAFAQESMAAKRITDAFFPKTTSINNNIEKENKTSFDAVFTYSDAEELNSIDFDSMSALETRQAKIAISKLKISKIKLPTRRLRSDPKGRYVDIRATMRSSLRHGSSSIDIKRRKKILRQPPLVILCDISGSMSRYSRMFLHFMHSITNDMNRISTFVFGTRLTNITRYLHQRDIDLALEKVGGRVKDWAGGTRIGECLHEFNHNWSRRVLGQGAIVILISDGLDRGSIKNLGFEMDRLHNSCRRLIWLNPLMRYDKYEAKASGAAVILPHVDELRTIHNLNSMLDLANALSRNPRTIQM